MKIESFKYEGVKPDGTFIKGAGSIHTNGRIVMSETNGGCSLKGCNCSQGHWISIVKPRTEDGVVECVKVSFDNQAEMDLFFMVRNLDM